MYNICHFLVIASPLKIFYTNDMDLSSLSVNRKGGDVVKGKNTKENKSKKQKLDPIIVVAIINGLFALAIALINVLL